MSPFDPSHSFRRLARGALLPARTLLSARALSASGRGTRRSLGAPLAFGALFALALPLTSCDALAKVDRSTPEQDTELTVLGPSLFEPEPLASAKLAIDDTLGPAVKLLELRAYRDHWVIQAEDPERPGRLLQLEYRDGRMGLPLEMTLRGAGKLAENLFSLSDVSLTELPALVGEATKRVDPEDGVVDHVLVRRGLPFETDVRLRVFVKSPRRDGYLDADRTGRPIE